MQAELIGQLKNILIKHINNLIFYKYYYFYYFNFDFLAKPTINR